MPCWTIADLSALRRVTRSTELSSSALDSNAVHSSPSEPAPMTQILSAISVYSRARASVCGWLCLVDLDAQSHSYTQPKSHAISDKNDKKSRWCKARPSHSKNSAIRRKRTWLAAKLLLQAAIE